MVWPMLQKMSILKHKVSSHPFPPPPRSLPFPIGYSIFESLRKHSLAFRIDFEIRRCNIVSSSIGYPNPSLHFENSLWIRIRHGVLPINPLPLRHSLNTASEFEYAMVSFQSMSPGCSYFHPGASTPTKIKGNRWDIWLFVKSYIAHASENYKLESKRVSSLLPLCTVYTRSKVYMDIRCICCLLKERHKI